MNYTRIKYRHLAHTTLTYGMAVQRLDADYENTTIAKLRTINLIAACAVFYWAGGLKNTKKAFTGDETI
jgi:hypothetical protein